MKTEVYNLSVGDQQTVTRNNTLAAFDLGSGKFKVLVADVQGKSVQVKFSKMLAVELGADFAENPDKKLSGRIQVIAMEALLELKKDAEEHGATQFQGVATAIFRRAINGEAFLSRLMNETRVNLQIVSQEKEGVIGFNTAVALNPTVDEMNIVSWDSGNGSFQIVAKEGECHQVYEGPWGNSVVVKAFVEEVRKVAYTQSYAVNPITASELEDLIRLIQDKISLPDWLKNKLLNQETNVTAVGDNESIFAIAAKNIGSNHYTISQVRGAIQNMTGKASADFTSYVSLSSPETTLTRIILLYSVMEKFGIEEITFKESAGSTIGMMLDPDFWV